MRNFNSKSEAYFAVIEWLDQLKKQPIYMGNKKLIQQIEAIRNKIFNNGKGFEVFDKHPKKIIALLKTLSRSVTYKDMEERDKLIKKLNQSLLTAKRTSETMTIKLEKQDPAGTIKNHDANNFFKNSRPKRAKSVKSSKERNIEPAQAKPASPANSATIASPAQSINQHGKSVEPAQAKPAKPAALAEQTSNKRSSSEEAFSKAPFVAEDSWSISEKDYASIQEAAEKFYNEAQSDYHKKRNSLNAARVYTLAQSLLFNMENQYDYKKIRADLEKLKRVKKDIELIDKTYQSTYKNNSGINQSLWQPAQSSLDSYIKKIEKILDGAEHKHEKQSNRKGLVKA